MLVYTNGHGVNGFTLDPSIGEFCLSHPDMTIPQDGKTYSVNTGNFYDFPEGVKEYIKYCKEIGLSSYNKLVKRSKKSLIMNSVKHLS